jgi:simple sugar transport system substrate-binding protein
MHHDYDRGYNVGKYRIFLLLLFVLLLTACTNDNGDQTKEKNVPLKTEDAAGTDREIPQGVAKPLKVALVTRFATGSFFEQYSKGIVSQVEELGGTVTVYDSNYDLTKMSSQLERAINEKVDGIIINNGRTEALQTGVEKATKAGIPIVAYDSDLTLPGVTTIDQDDYLLAWQSLKQMGDDLNGRGKIAVIWAPGYNPMERREVMIDAFQKQYPEIEEVARLGTVTANTVIDTQIQVEALLEKYPNEGELNAIYSTWNEFTRGALQALEEAGRQDIKVYAIDLTEEDLPFMLKENSPWVAASATNPTDLGRVQARILYKKAAGEVVPDTFQMEPKLIKREVLPNDVTFEDIGEYVRGWEQSELGYSPWMKMLKKEAENRRFYNL